MLSNKKVKKDNTEEEKKIAEKLNEAISKAEEEKADEDLADDELTPAEELSTDIAVRLADVTAQRFAEITGDANLCAIQLQERRTARSAQAGARGLGKINKLFHMNERSHYDEQQKQRDHLRHHGAHRCSR